MIDSRKLPRVKVRFKTRYQSRQSEFETHVVSLSEGGVFLYATKLDPEGTMARLEIAMDETTAPVHATGEVIYAGFQDGLRGMGIRFSRITGPDRDVITRLVRAGAPALRG